MQCSLLHIDECRSGLLIWGNVEAVEMAKNGARDDRMPLVTPEEIIIVRDKDSSGGMEGVDTLNLS